MSQMVGSAEFTVILDTSVSGFSPGDPLLPKDVWPNIVSHLSHESIENVMFVCQYFRTLAQPRFFRTLAVKPYGVDGRTCSPRNQADSNWISQKLRFYSSSIITRHVQVCRMSPHRRQRHTYTTSPDNGEDSGRAIVNDVFDLLPNYPNLTELDLDCVCLTAQNLRQISRIPNLCSVLFTCCSTTSSTPFRLGIKTVLFTQYSRFTSMHGTSTPVLLSSLLNADVTESLCLMGNGISVAPYDAHMLPLRCLRTLCIDDAAITRASLPSFLSQLSSLREIIICPNGSTFTSLGSPLPPSTLPLLEAYEGPLKCIYHIAQGRPIRHLRISGNNLVNDLLRILLCFKSTVELESLQFQVDHVNMALLDQLFDELNGFLTLKALAIEFDIMDYKILTHILPTIHLPPDIEYLSIKSSAARNCTASDEPVVLRKAYLTRYPALRYVAFAYEGYSWQFDPSTGAPLKLAKTIEDWRHPSLTQAMIQKLSRTHIVGND